MGELRIPAVQAEGLCRDYRRGSETIRALKGIDVTINSGEFCGVMGRSGAGKTTLLNLMGLMDRPTRGRLTVLGHEVSEPTARLDALRRATLGFVFQDFYLIGSLTALENVMLPGLWRRHGPELSMRARRLLDRVGLGRRLGHRPSELSGGEMQRVAMARALVNTPKLLLADEPTGNLDTRTRIEIFELLEEFNRNEGLTVVVATHDRSLAPRFDRIIGLEDGNVRA